MIISAHIINVTNRLIFMIKYLIVFVIILGNSSYGKDSFGDKITLRKYTDLDYAIKNYKKFSTKDLLIKGNVDSVCSKKGCWMTLKNKSETVRVTFKDYGFFVPTSLQSTPVRVQGKLFEKVEDVDLRKHYLEDAGADRETLNKIKEAKKTYHIVATGVEKI